MAMTFEEYEEKHLHDLNHEARRLVRMGWNARASHGENDQKLTDEQVDESVYLEWAQSVNEELDPHGIGFCEKDLAEKARALVNKVSAVQQTGSADHLPDATQMVQGDVQLMGEVTDEEGNTYSPAMVVEFPTVEDFLAAKKAGQCRFTVFGGEA